MIDFRYHIVSIVAVFLALAVGILIGSSLLPGAAERALEGTVNSLRGSLRSTRQDLQAAHQQRDTAQARLEQVGAWATDGRLAGRPVVVVLDGAGARWHDDVLGRLAAAGAQVQGHITFTPLWETSPPEGEGDAAASMAAFGSSLLTPGGAQRAVQLAASGYMTLDGLDPAAWPGEGTAVVVFAATSTAGLEPALVATFARAAAGTTATMVTTGAVSRDSAVTLLRQAETPPRLSTFDSATDPTGPLAAVLSLVAAIAERGGHFGVGAGGAYVPPPA